MRLLLLLAFITVPFALAKICVESETYVLTYLNVEQLRIQILYSANALWFKNFEERKLWLVDEIAESMEKLKRDLQTVSFIHCTC
jgi:hypothetical protein